MVARKTWVWVLVGVLVVGLVGLVALAGAGAYFVMRHIQTEPAVGADALRAFESARAPFAGAPPLYQVDASGTPRATRLPRELPTSSIRPSHLWILAWSPDDDGRLVRMSLPLWIMRFGKRGIQLGRHGGHFDITQLELDVADLERIGPILIAEFHDDDGRRVLVWTQ